MSARLDTHCGGHRRDGARLISHTETDRVRLLHVTTVPKSLVFLTGQVQFMTSRGFEIEYASSPGPQLQEFAQREGVSAHAIPMPRRITPVLDIVAVLRIAAVIRGFRPHIVHAHTPKGGLLGTLAASLSGTAVRVYHMRGFPAATASGLRRWLLLRSEQVSCRLAHRVLCVSPSLRDVAIAFRVCPPVKAKVLCDGVEATTLFDPDRVSTGPDVRRELGIPPDARVLGFVGRVVRDKGFPELWQAWQRVCAEFHTARLLIVGEYEDEDPIPARIRHSVIEDPRVHFVPVVPRTRMPEMYSAMDALALPTFREGLPTVLLEAAAMRIPVVATRVTGCVDAVRHGENGTLVPPGDAEALASAIKELFADDALRRRFGWAGREWILQTFRSEVMWELLLQEYGSLLRAAALPPPRFAGPVPPQAGDRSSGGGDPRSS